ncbi:MAG: hypothetical protein ABI488_18950 [Polyangiaceae bacterium]
MLQSRVIVSGLSILLSAVACGGSAQVDGAAGGPGAGGPGAGGNGSSAGASARAGAPGYAGAPGGPGGAPAGTAGNPSTGDGGNAGYCTVAKVNYPNGASWACDCNTCSCYNGQISSTTVACYACSYGGNRYFAGQSFPSLDGCNTCSCDQAGGVSCTELGCACNPPQEWSKKYATTDPQSCALLDFVCPGNTSPFQNSCGCGCQQASSCPEWIDCAPSPQDTNCEAQKTKCPFSKLAL